jgi:hypothetical protein
MQVRFGKAQRVLFEVFVTPKTRLLRSKSIDGTTLAINGAKAELYGQESLREKPEGTPSSSH